MFFLHGCLSTTCVPGACSDHKRALDYLELELQVIVVLRTKPRLSAGTARAISPVPVFCTGPLRPFSLPTLHELEENHRLAQTSNSFS